MRTMLAALVLLLFTVAPATYPQLAETARQKLREAMELASRGDFGASERLLRDLTTRHPNDGELQYRLGLVLMRQGKLSEAGSALESAVSLQPESPQPWLAIARVRLHTDRRPEAVQAIEQANRLAPDEPVVWRASAMFFAQAGDFGKAAQYEVRWSKAHPEDKESPLRAMEYFLRAGEPEPVIELGQKALKQDDLAVTHNLLGRAYRLKHESAKAVEELQTALRLDPGTPIFYIDLAQLFLDHNTHEPALMILERAARRFPNDVEVLHQFGLACYAGGDHASAIGNFLKVTDLAPDSELGFAALETLLPHAEDRLPEIITRLRGFCRRNPSNPLGFYLLSQALAAQSGATDETQRLLRQAISLEPRFWPAIFELHKKLEKDENYPAAVHALEQTVHLSPNHVQAHYSLARIYARQGEREKARQARQRHHELVLAERAETEARQAEYPRLPYTLRAGGDSR